MIKNSISKTINDLVNWVHLINKNSKVAEKILLKFYDSLPLGFYWRQDNSIFVGPYLYGLGSQQTVTYEIDISSTLGKFYLNYFENLWNKKDFSYEYKK